MRRILQYDAGLIEPYATQVDINRYRSDFDTEFGISNYNSFIMLNYNFEIFATTGIKFCIGRGNNNPILLAKEMNLIIEGQKVTDATTGNSEFEMNKSLAYSGFSYETSIFRTQAPYNRGDFRKIDDERRATLINNHHTYIQGKGVANFDNYQGYYIGNNAINRLLTSIDGCVYIQVSFGLAKSIDTAKKNIILIFEPFDINRMNLLTDPMGNVGGGYCTWGGGGNDGGTGMRPCPQYSPCQ
jgi:hypothetical protein